VIDENLQLFRECAAVLGNVKAAVVEVERGIKIVSECRAGRGHHAAIADRSCKGAPVLAFGRRFSPPSEFFGSSRRPACLVTEDISMASGLLVRAGSRHRYRYHG
jgi:hypothetical protein